MNMTTNDNLVDIYRKNAKSLLIQDCLEDRLTFLIPYFIKSFLELKDTTYQIILITISHDVAYYHQILEKWKFQLNPHLEAENLKLINLINLKDNQSLYDHSGEYLNLKNLFNKIKNMVNYLNEEELILIIDDITIMKMCTKERNELWCFLNYCCELNFKYVIGLCHEDEDVCNLKDGKRIDFLIRNCFEMKVRPDALEQSSLARIDGKLDVSWKGFNKALFYAFREFGIIFNSLVTLQF